MNFITAKFFTKGLITIIYTTNLFRKKHHFWNLWQLFRRIQIERFLSSKAFWFKDSSWILLNSIENYYLYSWSFVSSHWSNVSKYLQYPNTFLGIITDLSNAVVWMIYNLHHDFQGSSKHVSNEKYVTPILANIFFISLLRIFLDFQFFTLVSFPLAE